MNLIIPVNGRPALLRQTVASLLSNVSERGLFAGGRYTLTIVVDGVHDASIDAYVEALGTYSFVCVHHTQEALGVGGAKNRGALITRAACKEGLFRLSEHVVFCDADLFALPGWDRVLTDAFASWPELGVLGGWLHPFLRPNATITKGNTTFEVPDAVPGVCFAMPWSLWDQHSPEGREGAFMDNARGPGQSEDWQLCQRVKEAGAPIAVVTPYPMIHCGMINSAGEPACGHEAMRELAIRQGAVHRLNMSETAALGGFIVEEA